MKNRVLLIASFPGSLVAFRGHLVRDLLSAGFEVHVAAPGLNNEPSVRSFLRSLGVQLHDVPLSRTGTNPLADLAFLFRLYMLQVAVRPEVALSYTVKPVVYGTLAAWLARVPRRFALITGLGYAFTGARRSILAGLVQGLYRIALARADKVFFQNPDDQALFREVGILPAGKLSVVVNGSGVDVAAFEQQGVHEGAPTYLMIGRLLGDKGVREYADAAGRVRSLHPEARFGLVGWIDENPDAIAQDELAAWVASGTIEFYGKLDDVRPAIAASTVYVLPSYREGTPRVGADLKLTRRADLKLTRGGDGQTRWPSVDNSTVCFC